MSSLVREAQSDKKKLGGGGGGGGGGGAALKPKQYARLCQIQKCNYLHNVEHVVQSSFQNTLISF